MKKTLTANIGGLVFHLEEDAYAALLDYLDRVRRRFAGTGSDEEIMADIEARIAELLHERQGGRREVVTLTDVEEVMRVMGRPEQFGEEAEAAEGAATGSSTGTGRAERRLYRDTDDRWVAGVLSGLAAYIGTEVLWLRIAFIVLVAVGWGAPLLFYFILWLLVPEAHTSAERLRMRGEAVTAENLKRMFEEGAERVKDGAERMADEARNMGRRYGPRARAWSGEVADVAGRSARGAAGVLVRIIGLFLLVVGGGFAVALFGATVGALGFTWYGGRDLMGMDLIDLGALFLPSVQQAWWVLAGLFVVLAVPMVMLLMAGFSLLLDVRTPRIVVWSAGALWWLALGVVLVVGLRSGADVIEEARVENITLLATPTGGVLLLNTLEGDSVHRTSYSYRRFASTWNHSEGIYRSGDSLHTSFTWLEVERSADSLYHLVVVREARGRHVKRAVERGEHLSTRWRQAGDSLLVGQWNAFPAADKFRFQRVRYVVQVPVGGAVRFLPGSARVIHDVPNTTNTSDHDMIGRTWRMTGDGLAVEGEAQVGPDTKKHGSSSWQAAIPFRGLPRRAEEPTSDRRAPAFTMNSAWSLLTSVVRR